MIVKEYLNYGLGESALWVVFIFEKILSVLNENSDDAIENRVVVDGYQIDSPKFDQKSHPTITIQMLKKAKWTAPRVGGRTSTSITRTRKYTFGIEVTGDQGRIYEMFFYHYYNGSPQFIAWNQEFFEQYNISIPEWGSDQDVDANNNDGYGVGNSWIMSFLHTIDYSSSPVNLDNIEIPDNAVIAEYNP